MSSHSTGVGYNVCKYRGSAALKTALQLWTSGGLSVLIRKMEHEPRALQDWDLPPSPHGTGSMGGPTPLDSQGAPKNSPMGVQ